MKKSPKILSIILVAWQIPMAYLWYLTYQAIKMYCHEIKVYSDGGYALVFNPSLVGDVLWQNASVIISLVASLVLSVLCLVFVLRKQGQVGIPVICISATALIIGTWLFLAFRYPSLIGDELKRYKLCEFMFFRYDVFKENVGINFASTVFPILEHIKLAFINIYIFLHGLLGGLGICQIVNQKKQRQQQITN